MTTDIRRSALPTRRAALTGLLGAAALTTAACNSEDEQPKSSAAASTSSGPTPVAHPAGLSYGSWLRPSSHLLDAAGTKAVLVEFLDFECESCGALYPVIEQFREEFRGKLTYGIRYFPLDGHRNARPAAYAVEAAARQKKLQPMYEHMYVNQRTWGEKSESVDDVFQDFAQRSGLDMPKWESDRASASVKARVEVDLKDARALELTGTPTLFLNGKTIQPKDVADLRSMINAAVA
ncbi:DsbA family protein [Dermacoccaceae bacterium W4C1]